MRNFLRENGLSVALFALFFVSLVGQSLAGHRAFNEQLDEHGAGTIGYLAYLHSGHFVESVFENWESEFLQMAAFVLMTIFLRQKGSSESKPLSEKKTRERAARKRSVTRSRWRRFFRENSLSLVLAALFFFSFALHAAGGAAYESRERVAHGKPPVGVLPYVASSQFWFESFQNWQSEFLSVGVLIVLSIFLRQKGSPQSKEVDAPNDRTGE